MIVSTCRKLQTIDFDSILPQVKAIHAKNQTWCEQTVNNNSNNVLSRHARTQIHKIYVNIHTHIEKCLCIPLEICRNFVCKYTMHAATMHICEQQWKLLSIPLYWCSLSLSHYTFMPYYEIVIRGISKFWCALLLYYEEYSSCIAWKFHNSVKMNFPYKST